MSFAEVFAATSALGDSYAKGLEERRKRDLLTALGARLQSGDYAGAASTALGGGELDAGIALLKLNQADAKEKRIAGNDALVGGFLGGLGPDASGGYGGDPGAGTPTTGPRSDRSVPSFADMGGPSAGYQASLFRRESGGDPNAQASTSSARGLGQFIPSTWNRLAGQRPDLGLTPIGGGRDGRTDPDQMVRATQALTEQNADALRSSRLPVNDSTLYATHFLGVGGGRRFVAGAMADPDRPATSIVGPDQVAANRNVFFNRDGSAKTAGQVMGDFARSFGGGAPAARTAARPTLQPDFAANEVQTQALERRLGMLPPDEPTSTASLDPRADMPAPDAFQASARAPGLVGRPVASGGTMSRREMREIEQEALASQAEAQRDQAVAARGLPSPVGGGFGQAPLPSGAFRRPLLSSDPNAVNAPAVTAPASRPQQVASLDPRVGLPGQGTNPRIFRAPITQPDETDAPSVSTLNAPPPGRSAMTMPGDPIQVAQAGPDLSTPAGRREEAQQRQVQSVANLPNSQRISKLLALSSLELSEGPRQTVQLMLKQALDESKLPDRIKEFMIARANGWTTAKTPGEYEQEGKPRGTAAPGTAVLKRDGSGIDYIVPDRDKTTGDIEARKAAAGDLGLQPGSPGYQSYALTGKMPREDAQPLTALDKKAIQDADTAVLSAQSTVGMLNDAKALSKKAYEGPTAGMRGYGMAMMGNEAGIATQDLDNLVTTQALQSLKSIFGGNPTEGERAILLEIQGSSSKPDAVRQRIYDRAIGLANLRMRQNQEKADELRGLTYYRPGGGGTRQREDASSSGPGRSPGSGASGPPTGAIDMLRANPNLANDFDAKYGAGSAARVFGGY